MSTIGLGIGGALGGLAGQAFDALALPRRMVVRGAGALANALGSDVDLSSGDTIDAWKHFLPDQQDSPLLSALSFGTDVALDPFTYMGGLLGSAGGKTLLTRQALKEAQLADKLAAANRFDRVLSTSRINPLSELPLLSSNVGDAQLFGMSPRAFENPYSQKFAELGKQLDELPMLRGQPEAAGMFDQLRAANPLREAPLGKYGPEVSQPPDFLKSYFNTPLTYGSEVQPLSRAAQLDAMNLMKPQDYAEALSMKPPARYSGYAQPIEDVASSVSSVPSGPPTMLGGYRGETQMIPRSNPLVQALGGLGQMSPEEEAVILDKLGLLRGNKMVMRPGMRPADELGAIAERTRAVRGGHPRLD